MRINLTDIGTVYPFLLTNNPDEVRINCPECDDIKYHCYCNFKKKLFHCFKCERSGRLVDELRIDVKEWDKVREGFHGVGKIEVKEEHRIKNLPMSGKIVKNGNYSLHRGTQYLLERGVTWEQIEKYRIRISDEKSGRPCKNTVIFPIYQTHNEPFPDDKTLKYFVCRKWDKTEPKYINAPWPKDDTLFQTGDRKLGSNSEFNAIIVEGIFDALAIERAGYNSIALLGKRANSKQLERLMQTNKDGSPCKFIIYLDRDALSQAIHLKLQFSALNIKSVIIQHKQDAASLALSDMNELRTLIHAQGT